MRAKDNAVRESPPRHLKGVYIYTPENCKSGTPYCRAGRRRFTDYGRSSVIVTCIRFFSLPACCQNVVLKEIACLLLDHEAFVIDKCSAQWRRSQNFYKGSCSPSPCHVAGLPELPVAKARTWSLTRGLQEPIRDLANTTL